MTREEASEILRKVVIGSVESRHYKLIAPILEDYLDMKIGLREFREKATQALIVSDTKLAQILK